MGSPCRRAASLASTLESAASAASNPPSSSKAAAKRRIALRAEPAQSGRDAARQGHGTEWGCECQRLNGGCKPGCACLRCRWVSNRQLPAHSTLAVAAAAAAARHTRTHGGLLLRVFVLLAIPGLLPLLLTVLRLVCSVSGGGNATHLSPSQAGRPEMQHTRPFPPSAAAAAEVIAARAPNSS